MVIDKRHAIIGAFHLMTQGNTNIALFFLALLMTQVGTNNEDRTITCADLCHQMESIRFVRVACSNMLLLTPIYSITSRIL